MSVEILKETFFYYNQEPTLGEEGHKRIVRFNGDHKYSSQMYLNLPFICPNKCPFCRNENLLETNHDFEKQVDSLKLYGRFLKSFTVGGGEPLYGSNINLLKQLIDVKNKKENEKELRHFDFNLVTSMPKVGDSSIFIDENFNFLRNFQKIYISRLHFDDKINEKLFNHGKYKLLQSDEFNHLDSPSCRHNTQNFETNVGGYRLQLLCTCFKGGIDTTEKIFQMIEWMIQLQTITNITFSNLYNCNHLNVSPYIFEEASNILISKGFEMKPEIVFSGNYLIKRFSLEDGISIKNHFLEKREFLKQPLTVAFKYYLTKSEMSKIWHNQNTLRRIYDLAMLQDGTVITESI